MLREIGVVGIRQPQSQRARVLQRGGSANCQKIMHLSNRPGNARRSDDVTDTPACHAKCLGHAIHDNRALAHAVERDR